MSLRARTVITAGWEPLLRAHGLESVEGVYRLDSGRVITRSGSVEVRQVELGRGAEARTVFIKKYWIGKPSQLWSGMFRGTFFGRSKARCEYENLLRLRSWNLDAPQAVAFGEERRAGWLLRSFLISESVPDPQPLHLFIRQHAVGTSSDQSRRTRRELIERLAACTSRLHAQGFVHHDYFWRNILLSGSSLEHFHLIDAHKGRCWRPWQEMSARAQDLAALDAPAPHFFRRSERLRFFLLYRGHSRLDAQDKALLRLVLDKAAPQRERQLRRALAGSDS